jgi:hypothetical protein
MARPAPVARMTYAEYLVAEAASDVRHEYLSGEVWAMAGGTPEHSALAAAIDLASLGVHLDVAAIYANPLGQAAERP